MPALRRYRHVLIIVIIGAIVGGALAAYLIADRDSTAGRTPSTTPDPPTRHAVTTTRPPADDVALRKLAERYVDAVNRADDETVAQLNCAARPGLTQVAANGKPVRLAGDLEWNPNRDRAYFAITIDGERTGRLTLEQRNGTWCVRD
jgi:hypothetical protein